MSNILIVDDNSDNLRLLADLLIGQGYNIRAVKNGENSIISIKKKLPDLILLDIMMPGSDGYEVCQQIKKIKAAEEIPIIFVTALAENKSKALAFKSGGIDYITKPIQTDEVLTCIKTHLNIRMLNTELTKKDHILSLKNLELEKKQLELQQVKKKKQMSKKYRKVNLPENIRKDYAKRLESLMLIKQPFLNEKLTVLQVAEELKIPCHHLSMTINIEKKLNFYNYINAIPITKTTETKVNYTKAKTAASLWLVSL